MYSLRSINNIILCKEGSNILLTTYSPFFKLRTLNIPLENVIISIFKLFTKAQVFFLLLRRLEFTPIKKIKK